MVGARIAGNVTHAEEHHGDLPESWPRTLWEGRVNHECLRPSAPTTERRWPGRRSSAMSAGPTEADGLRFNGYVVEFENSHEPT